MRMRWPHMVLHASWWCHTLDEGHSGGHTSQGHIQAGKESGENLLEEARVMSPRIKITKVVCAAESRPWHLATEWLMWWAWASDGPGLIRHWGLQSLVFIFVLWMAVLGYVAHSSAGDRSQEDACWTNVDKQKCWKWIWDSTFKTGS